MPLDISSLPYTELRYNTQHELQSIDIWRIPPQPHAPAQRYWVVFIHGGAWRDPRDLKATGRPTLKALLSSTYLPHIAGFASIDYRLSPHPQFPQDPNDTPAYTLRVARHPDHLADVVAALTLLHGSPDVAPGFSDGYILVGHSCGAMLALQTLMNAQSIGVYVAALPLAKGIVGVEGLYDIAGLNDRCGGGLKEINEGAFGPDEKMWRKVSPGLYSGPWGKGDAWEGSVVLGWSKDDELVDGGEIDTMEGKLKDHNIDHVALRDLKGAHDQVRDEGVEVVRCLEALLKRLDERQHDTA